MPQAVSSILIEDERVSWLITETRGDCGHGFVVAETADKTVGITARDVRGIVEFCNSLRDALAAYIIENSSDQHQEEIRNG